jgi:hypothetical protein
MKRREPDSAEVESALLARVQAAIDAAERIRVDSEVLLDVSTALRDETLRARCAWCGRYRIGRRWLLADQLPILAAYSQVTHTICPDCTAVLRETGMSV